MRSLIKRPGRFVWTGRVGSKGRMWAVIAFVWALTAAMGNVTGAVWAATASMWALHALCCLL